MVPGGGIEPPTHGFSIFRPAILQCMENDESVLKSAGCSKSRQGRLDLRDRTELEHSRYYYTGITYRITSLSLLPYLSVEVDDALAIAEHIEV
jgi:hypothetical protein